MSIDQLIESGARQAETVLIGQKDASLIPTFVVQFKDRPSAIIGTPWSGDREKYAVTQAMRGLLKQHRDSVVSYLFWSEAWTATEDIKHPTGLTPSQREDKREVVILSAFDHDGGKMVTLEIERGHDGVVTGLKRDAPDDWKVLGGRLHNLLQDD